jgi:hypothetical protein
MIPIPTPEDSTSPMGTRESTAADKPPFWQFVATNQEGKARAGSSSPKGDLAKCGSVRPVMFLRLRNHSGVNVCRISFSLVFSPLVFSTLVH